MPEELETCKSGAPTLDGSNYSDSKEDSLSTQLTTRSLMLKEERMKKVKPLECGAITEESTNNGK